MKAHGVEYASKAEAEARIAEINEEIFKYGVSDGRVTEVLCIITMLQEEGLEEAPVLPEPPKPPIDWELVRLKERACAYYVVDDTLEIIVEGGWTRLEYAEERAMLFERNQPWGPDAHEFSYTFNPPLDMLREYEASGRGYW